MTAQPASAVAFAVNVLRLPQKGMPVAIEADAHQRAMLAAAHDLLDVSAFCAEMLVARWQGEGVRVTGRVRASVVQACVVTLEPVPADIDAAIDALFVPERSKLARADWVGGELLLDPDGPDAPETFSGETIDVGALAEEFFVLALDPYPRSAGAQTLSAEAPEDADDSPFARLRALKAGD